MLIQGPLCAALRGRRFIMDDADLAHYRRFGPKRLDRWVKCGIHVAGRPDRVFIKLHCHGAEDRNREALLGTDLDALFTDAESRYNDGQHYRLHYVSAREMFNIVKATEEGVEGDINRLRNHLINPPPCRDKACINSKPQSGLSK